MSTRRRGAAAGPASGAAATWEEREVEGRAGGALFEQQTSANGSHDVDGKVHSSRGYGTHPSVLFQRCKRMLVTGVAAPLATMMQRRTTLMQQLKRPMSNADRIVQDFGIVAAISFVFTAAFTILLFRYAWILQHSSSLFGSPIIIRRLDFASVDDVGGWSDRPYAFPRLSTLVPMEDGEEDEYKRGVPDYGTIHYTAVPPNRFYRIIDPEDEERYEEANEETTEAKVQTRVTSLGIR